MNSDYLQYQIQQLRQLNLQRLLESIVVFIAALFVTALLPSLLVRYAYANQPLLTEPRALEVIPIITFSIAMLHFLYVLVTNWMRGSMIARLQTQLAGSMTDGYTTEPAMSSVEVAEMARLEQLVDEALADDDTNAAAARPARKTRAASKTRRSGKGRRGKK